MRIYNYVMRQMFHSKRFIVNIISACFLSLVSIYFLRQITVELSGVFMDMLEAYREGNHYNLWILSLHSLTVLNNFYDDDILTGVIPGSFLQLLTTLLITLFVYDAYHSGYLKYAVMKGIRRRTIYTSYVVTGILGIVPIVLIYELGVMMALYLDGRLHVMCWPQVIITVLVQFILLCSFSVMISAVILLMGNVEGIILSLGLVMTLPMMPNFIMLYTGGRINIAPIMILSLMENVYTFSPQMDVWAVMVALVTAVLAYTFGLVIFQNLNFK